MIIAVINTLFWVVLLIKDIKDYINIGKEWGKACGYLKFIILDILCLLVSLFLLMIGVYH